MSDWRYRDWGPSPLLREMLRSMGEAGPRPGGPEPMPINVYDDEHSVVVVAAIPGVRPEEVEVSGAGGVLSIRGRCRIEDRAYLHQELREVELSRQVALPPGCRMDRAEAQVDNGLLTVRVPKIEPRRPEKISIRVNRRSGETTAIEARKGEGYEDAG